MGLFGRDKTKMVDEADALPGRATALAVPARHFVKDAPVAGPYPDGLETAVFGLGCFWGAERMFWEHDDVYTTAVGYSGGITPNPTYDEVCSGLTGHNEVVLVAFEPDRVGYEALLSIFWEGHDPTQGMRQGNDIGTQYRSGIYVTDEQRAIAERSRRRYQERLTQAGLGTITTEIVDVGPFYFAEEYHQQYLAKNPMGYCGLGGTGVSCPVGVLGE